MPPATRACRRRGAHAGVPDHPGRGKDATEADTGPSELRHRVTSSGGTTQAAVEVLERGGFGALLADAIDAAAARSRELSPVET
jgi:pyrroline-5-carboxylate reductase